jgi:serine/threonine protein kinase
MMQFALPVGSRVNGYEIEAVLGHGQFGITYKTFAVAGRGQAAIKEYFPSAIVERGADGRSVSPKGVELTEDVAFGSEQFLQEGQALQTIAHPAVVRVTEALRANATAYVVMDYVVGQGLNEVLRSAGPLPEDELRSIITPLLDGLEQLHAAGVLHGEIKPANIYIDMDGSPVLLDFANARNALRGRLPDQFVMYGRGHYDYFAPEVLFGNSPAGPWSDIYSLGVTLYVIVAGDLPPDLHQAPIGDHDKNRASEVAKGRYSPHLLAAIDVALAPKPAHRPQTISELRTLMNIEA